jgi:serine phosphatase RsbU (regulator of sigma subunit)
VKPKVAYNFLNYKLTLADSLNNYLEGLNACTDILSYNEYLTPLKKIQLLKKKSELELILGLNEIAIKSLFKALELADSLQIDSVSVDLNRMIGTEYKNLGDTKLALKYLRYSLEKSTEFLDTIGIVNSYMTLGNTYKKMGEMDSVYLDTALTYYNKSLTLSKQINYLKGESGNYNNIGNIYRSKKMYKESLEQFFLALEINLKEKNDKWTAFNYNNIGVTYQKLNQPKTAILYFKKSLDLKAKTAVSAVDVFTTYLNLSQAFNEIGDHKAAYDYLVLYKNGREDFMDEERIKISQTIEAKFQSEKKEAEIDALKANQSVQALTIEGQKKDLDYQAKIRKNEQKLIYALGFILISLTIIVIVFWRNNVQRKKHNQLLALKNTEIELASNEIALSKKILEDKNKEITDSINYAKRIQGAMLPPQKVLNAHLGEVAVMYLPKDIVAGDFYWCERVGDHVLFAVGDCTGHGVPGALVSVICHDALNVCVKQKGLTSPAQILEETNKLVLEKFEQSEHEVKDGMDIALCSYHQKTGTLAFCGANLSAFLIRDNKLQKLEAIHQPIGRYEKRVQFSDHQFQIQPSDLLYLFTDGFADQFGGLKGKKYLVKNMVTHLLEFHQVPVNVQLNNLQQRFVDWKGEIEQVDDVCVMCVRF